MKIKLKACKKFAEGQMYHVNEYSESEVEEIAEHYSQASDGYDLAKDLEGYCGWSVDAGKVEELDCVSTYVDAEMKIERKKWFDENDIQPPFPIGTEIKEGVIDHIYEYDAAMYSVKRYGETNPTRFGIIRFENAKLKEGITK
jgi:hypothetical protein